MRRPHADMGFVLVHGPSIGRYSSDQPARSVEQVDLPFASSALTIWGHRPRDYRFDRQ